MVLVRTTSSASSAALGPVLAGAWFDKFNSYSQVFWFYIGMCLIAGIAALPHGANGMNDMTRRQSEAGGNDGTVHGTVTNGATGCLQVVGTRRTVNRTIHTATAGQLVVGGIDDSVHPQGGDIALPDFHAFAQNHP